MFGKIIVNKEEYECLKDAIESDRITRQYWVDHYMESAKRECELTKEIADLKTLLSKEADTRVVKYNGKLYRITSINYYQDGVEETLDFTAVPVSEVN